MSLVKNVLLGIDQLTKRVIWVEGGQPGMDCFLLHFKFNNLYIIIKQFLYLDLIFYSYVLVSHYLERKKTMKNYKNGGKRLFW